jgi:hypothetical protein
MVHGSCQGGHWVLAVYPLLRGGADLGSALTAGHFFVTHVGDPYSSWFGLDFVEVPSLRRRSVGPRRTDIHVLTALSRHPCRSALRIACVQPAPKSRLAVSGLSRTRATRAGANALRIFYWCINLPRSTLNCRSALALGRTRTICREPAVNPVHAVYQIQMSRLILLPLRGRSSECGPEQARSYRDCVNQQQAAYRQIAILDLSRHCFCPQGRFGQARSCFRLQAVGAWLVPRSAGDRQQNRCMRRVRYNRVA